MIDESFLPITTMKKTVQKLIAAAYRDDSNSTGWRQTWKGGRRRWRWTPPYEPPGIGFDVVVVCLLLFLIIACLLV